MILLGVLLGKVAQTTLSFEPRRKTGVCRARKDREHTEPWGGDVGTENPCLTENLTGVNLARRLSVSEVYHGFQCHLVYHWLATSLSEMEGFFLAQSAHSPAAESMYFLFWGVGQIFSFCCGAHRRRF